LKNFGYDISRFKFKRHAENHWISNLYPQRAKREALGT
jgi:hypothetical protein